MHCFNKWTAQWLAVAKRTESSHVSILYLIPTSHRQFINKQGGLLIDNFIMKSNNLLQVCLLLPRETCYQSFLSNPNFIDHRQHSHCVWSKAAIHSFRTFMARAPPLSSVCLGHTKCLVCVVDRWWIIFTDCLGSKHLIAQLVKNLPAMQETPVQFLGWEDPLEKG